MTGGPTDYRLAASHESEGARGSSSFRGCRKAASWRTHPSNSYMRAIPEWSIAPPCPSTGTNLERAGFLAENRTRKKMISTKITPDRSKIIIEREDHVKYWTRHFGVTKDELTRAIETVGNSAAAVRKQLDTPKSPAT